ncbi:MAG: site-specific DNA-methyltransferase [Chloroflexota bacterium]|nr:site-specific DNA-methyltransferase [Chloroflexota bacterium]MDE2948071.1 site-specific DNA-methyltransferase [Chloroflexota bacterium]
MINEILHGDCLEVLKDVPANFVDLVYLDPPFFSQSNHALKSKTLAEFSFNDTWSSMDAYIDYLGLRLEEIYRVMKRDCSVFVHCDRNASHRIRMLLDQVFGFDRFVSEIIWTYRRWSTAKNSLLGSHQTIFMYSKTENYKFNLIFQDYSETTNLDQILQRRERNQHGKAVYAKDSKGNVLLHGPKKGVPLSDTWNIPYLNPKARERCGYPTQKPLLLLERIVMLASNKGDLILDPFCGSGTTLVAAKLLNRNYLGIDSSGEAVDLSRKRIENPIRSDSRVLKTGRAAYRNLPEEVASLLRQLPVKLVQRNSGFDAIHDEFVDGKPVILRVQRNGEDLAEAAEKLQRAGKTKDAALLILVRTETEGPQHTLFDMFPEDVHVIDSLEVAVQSKLENLLQQVH